ncbi:hypothetical protein NMY22_g962 [Coprinellus aureogranulatus]|nr:hypothetical protein NMY22_g962 [Coprinellus aureogranulatus]
MGLTRALIRTFGLVMTVIAHNHIDAYFSRVFGELWLAGSSPPRGQGNRLHVYNVYDNQLDEVHHIPDTPAHLFQGFYLDAHYKDALSVKIDVETSRVLAEAERLFHSLEDDVIMHLRTVLHQLSGKDILSESCPSTSKAPAQFTFDPEIKFATLSLANWAKIRRFLVFLRFRNSAGYANIVRKLASDLERREEDGNIYPAYKTFVVQMQRRYVLRAFIDFLHGNDRRESQRMYDHVPSAGVQGSEDKFVDFFHEVMDCYCWRMLEAEMCLGVVKEERETGKEEYIVSETCYGSLDEGFDEDPDSCDFFFPINPFVSLYLLGTSPADPLSPLLNATHTMISIPVGLEGMIDVHMRNSMILQTYPNHLVFSSLKCIVCSLKSYDEFRWINEHQDYSRLRMRCRQKYSKEQLLKTLVLRDRNGLSSDESEPDSEDEMDLGWEAERRRRERSDSGTRKKGVRVFDLTDQVTLEGSWAVGFGTFSDVWKGKWQDPMERRERLVAVKFLRSVMVQNVKERLIRRIQAEVSTWHKLCHRNVSQFFGIVQSSSSFGMVSPWYLNGVICDYLKVAPDADRLKLLVQIASGVNHLHAHSPPIVHGDLKGGNILIDVHGYAIITDFGLSKVMEEVSQACSDEENTPPGTACGGRGTSVFAGSTRWMAPELIVALVNDDEFLDGDNSDGDSTEDTRRRRRRGPTITTMSDVYAFAAVCLEVATDELPYAHRSNDHAVILDILRSISPRPRNSRSKCKVQVGSTADFWTLLDACWAVPQERRPNMLECLRALERMAPGAEGSQSTSVVPYAGSASGQYRKRSH